MRVQFLNKTYVMIIIGVMVLCIFSCKTMPDDPNTNFIYFGMIGDEISLGDNYDSYTMFINPSYEYNNTLEREKIDMLGKIFIKFSKSIGDNNLAFWCGRVQNSNFYFNVARSKDYSDKFGIDYNNGPYVILTIDNPDDFESLIEKKAFIISFSKINPNRIIFILNELERKLRTHENIALEKLIYTQIVYSHYDNSKEFINKILLVLLGKI